MRHGQSTQGGIETLYKCASMPPGRFIHNSSGQILLGHLKTAALLKLPSGVHQRGPQRQNAHPDTGPQQSMPPERGKGRKGGIDAPYVCALMPPNCLIHFSSGQVSGGCLGRARVRSTRARGVFLGYNVPETGAGPTKRDPP